MSFSVSRTAFTASADTNHSNIGNHTVDLSTIAPPVGALILLVHQAPIADSLVSVPTGWTALANEQSPDTSYNLFAVLARVADGTEGAVELGYPDCKHHSHKRGVTSHVFVVENWAGTLSDVECAVSGTLSGSSMSVPSLTPSWGSDDTLWIALIGAVDDGATFTQFPAGYGNTKQTKSDEGQNNSSEMASCWRMANAATESPGGFSLSENEGGYTALVAVKPSSGGQPDTQAPTLTSPAGAATGENAATGSVSTDEAGGTLNYLISKSATATKAAVQAASSQAVTMIGTQSVSASNLDANTTYYWHFQQNDASGNESDVASSSAFTTDQPQDTQAPTLTSPTASATGNTTATGSVSTDEAAARLYWIASESTTAPDKTEVLAGNEANNTTAPASGDQAVTATGAQSVSVTGLAKNTTYYLYFAQKDAAGNISDVVATSAFTTDNSVLLELHGDFDGSNLDEANSTVANGDSSTPTVDFGIRTPDDGVWRQFYFKITNANGKRPTFTFSDVDYSNDRLTGAHWRPWYSYDSHDWHWMDHAPTVSGHKYTFQFSSAFTQDTVYIAFQPAWPVGHCVDLIDWLETNHADKIHKLPSGEDGYIADTISSQVDENSRVIPAQPLYAFGIWDSTQYPDDDKPKRTVTLTSGMHAGEHSSGYLLEGFLKFLLNGSAEANELLKNFQFMVYPMLNPIGRWGGAQRSSFEDLNADPNRDWDAFALELTQKARDAFNKDSSGRKVVLSYDFHATTQTGHGSEVVFVWTNKWMDTAGVSRFTTALSQEGGYSVYHGGNNPITINRWWHRNRSCPQAHTPEIMPRLAFPSGMETIYECGRDLARTLGNLLTVAPADMAYAGNYIAETLTGNGTVPQQFDAAVYPWPPRQGDTIIASQRGQGADANREFRMDLGDYPDSQAFVVISSANYEPNHDDTESGANIVGVKTA